MCPAHCAGRSYSTLLAFDNAFKFLSEEGCHWFNVALPSDVVILDVVLFGLASSPSQHSHLSGVQFLGICFLTVQHSDPCVIAGFTMVL